MGKILVVGANAATAKVAVSLSTIFNDDNCVIVYKSDGNYKSWEPGRSLNAITALEVNSGYIIIMKQTLDVSAFLDIQDNEDVSFNIFNNTTETLTLNKVTDPETVPMELDDFPVGSAIPPGVLYGVPLDYVTDNDLNDFTFVSSEAKTYQVVKIFSVENGSKSSEVIDEDTSLYISKQFANLYSAIIGGKTTVFVVSNIEA